MTDTYLVSTAARLIGDVARLRERAQTAKQRLATLTIETEIAFASPRALRAFTAELQPCMVDLTERYQRGAGGRRYRVVIASRPAVTRLKKEEHF